MMDLEAAVVEVASALDELQIPYMLMGGVAVSLWGVVRATIDADFSLWIGEADTAPAARLLASRFQAIPTNAEAFAAEFRVLPVETRAGVRADLIFASLPHEREAIERAQSKTVGQVTIRVASVEDLIWMKLLSERGKDQEDARLLLRRFAAALDRAYLEPRLLELSEAFARADIRDAYRRAIGG